MSFILDALKKSENKRRKKSVQRPHSVHAPLAYRVAKKRSWALWILFALIVNALLLAWYLLPRSDAGLSSQPVATAIEDKTVRPGSPPAGSSPAPRAGGATDDDQGADFPAALTEAEPRSTEPQISGALKLPRNAKQIYTLQQLPRDIQRRIPELVMALHAYNRRDAAAGLVQINNRIYRAGEHINTELAVDMIVEEGVVLRYDGYRFLLPRRGK